MDAEPAQGYEGHGPEAVPGHFLLAETHPWMAPFVMLFDMAPGFVVTLGKTVAA